MSKKEFIKDGDGKIRDCYSNVAKMSPFEYCRYIAGLKSSLFPILPPTKDDVLAILFTIIHIIAFVLQIIPFGIVISLLCSMAKIKKAKEEVDLYNKRIKHE